VGLSKGPEGFYGLTVFLSAATSFPQAQPRRFVIGMDESIGARIFLTTKKSVLYALERQRKTP
jgi:hypothetical protein